MDEQIAELVAYLRDEADFNLSWTDGRRGEPREPAYVARRMELARQRDRWADAVCALASSGPAPCPASVTGNPIDCGGCAEHATSQGPDPSREVFRLYSECPMCGSRPARASAEDARR
jgi:hypothetical protein